MELTTAPDANGATHWGQQAFFLSPTVKASDGGVITGRLELKRKQAWEGGRGTRAREGISKST